MSHIFSKPSRLKRIASWAGILCIACCTAPLIGIAIGSAGLAGLAIYSEKAVAVILIVAASLFAYLLFVRRNPPSCGLDRSRRPASTDTEQAQKDELP